MFRPVRLSWIWSSLFQGDCSLLVFIQSGIRILLSWDFILGKSTEYFTSDGICRSNTYLWQTPFIFQISGSCWHETCQIYLVNHFCNCLYIDVLCFLPPGSNTSNRLISSFVLLWEIFCEFTQHFSIVSFWRAKRNLKLTCLSFVVFCVDFIIAQIPWWIYKSESYSKPFHLLRLLFFSLPLLI